MLNSKINRFLEHNDNYDKLLDISGDGVMGYIEIPSIQVTLPIYHGTEDAVLRAGVGHIEGSSLPVGGIGTHCVLSGHRGLPSSKLFTDLDNLEEGDIFILNILGKQLEYRVIRTDIVEPSDTSGLTIDENEDLCSLITCTPYGINSHRLIVTGIRTDTDASVKSVISEARMIEPFFVLPFIALPLLAAAFVFALVSFGYRSKGEK